MAEETIRQVFVIQAKACESLGSVFTGSLCRRLSEGLNRDTAVGRLCLDWEGDTGPGGDSVPLRLCGGFHALVLSNRDPAFAESYDPQSGEAPSIEALNAALTKNEAFFLRWMQSPPQTNEVARSAVVWPAMMLIASETGLPLRLLEVGASAGLNLQMDRFGYRYGDVTCGEAGSALQLSPEMRGTDVAVSPVQISARSGCDINPLDLSDDEQVLRLRSYIWPDQPDRRARFDAAVAIARSNPVTVERVDAVDWLQRELAAPDEGVCTVIYSTIAWQYLPKSARDEGKRLIIDAGRRASAKASLAWLHFEADGQSPGAKLTLQLWPGGAEKTLARGDFHGRWLDWCAPR